MKKYKLNQNQKNELQSIIPNKESKSDEIKRAQVILMLEQDHESESIMLLTGYKKSQIYEIRRNYFREGIIAIKDKRKSDPKKILTKKQKTEIIEIITTKIPCNYGYHTEFWSTLMLGDLIERLYKVKYKSRTSYYLLFRQSKFSYHSPGKVYKRRNAEEVKKWIEENKPKFENYVKEENTIILASDEMVLSSKTTVQKIWYFQGQYPKIEDSGKKDNRSIYGFLNIKTGEVLAIKTKWQNMYITCDVLKEVRKKYPNRKIIIYWDQAGWHLGSEVKAFIKKDKNIETLNFPASSPDLNPQEHVWKKGREEVSHNRYIDNIDTVTDEFVAYLNKTIFQYSFLGYSPIS